MKRGLIFGVTGQDGHYLTRHLLSKGYSVTGVTRRSSVDNTERIAEFLDDPNFEVIEGDVTDSFSVDRIIKKIYPHEVYNLSAQSHVATSFEQPGYTFNVVAGGALNILESIRSTNLNIKMYQASSSEMFGKNYSTDHNGRKYQDENTPFMPQSPYAIAKLGAHHLVRNYRDSYGIFACSGILFNHESKYRGEKFVTRKITKWIGEFKAFLENVGPLTFDIDTIFSNGISFPKLRLGNLDARRDWGHASDFTYGMYLMLQQENPDDYVLSTGVTTSIRTFLDIAFNKIGIRNWDDYVVIDKKFYRPSEVDYLCGDSSKARKLLNWAPDYDLEQLVEEMVEYDTEKARQRCRQGSKSSC